VSGLGTGIATALAVNTGSAGAPVLFNGALGTPTSGTVTNLTGTASININGTVGATTPSTVAATTVTAAGAILNTLGGGGNGFAARFNASNPRAGLFTLGTAGTTLLGNNLTFSSANVFNHDVTGTAWAAGDIGTGTFDVFVKASGTAGTTAFDFATTANRITSVSTTGLAVTGALSSTGLITSGTGNSTPAFTANGATTGWTAATFINSGGTSYFGTEASVGGTLVAGSTAYDALIRTHTGLSISTNSGSGTQVRVSATGVAVTGALSSTGALAIGNTVNTVSPTSPNRTVTIVIGGTTYYLAAKTTND
jgi:hypothetical protein